MADVILLPRQPLVLTTAQPRFASLAVPLGLQTASITLRLSRPTTLAPVAWGVLDRIRTRIVVELDGEFYVCEGRVVGGVRTTLLGVEAAEYRLSYGLPSGYFGAREGLPKRLGELRQARYLAHIEIERLDGTIETDLLVESVEAPLPAIPFHSSVAFDAATDAQEGAGGDGVLSLTHTAGGSNRAVFAGNGSNAAAARTTTSITYGGTGMTEMWDQQFTSGAGNFGSAGYRLAAPATGAQTVTSTLNAGTDEHLLGVMSMTGVDQTTPVGTPPTPVTGTLEANMTITVANVGNDDLVVDNILMYNPAAAAAPGANQTSPPTGYSETVTGLTGIKGSTQAGTSGGVMSWTNDFSDTSFILGAVAFKPAAGAAQDKMRWPIGMGIGGRGGTNLRPGMIG